MHHETIAADAATEARADVVLSGPALRDAVKLLTGKAVERRATVAALAALHFDIAPDGAATITATDLDMWASVTLAACGDSCDSLEPGRFAVNADALHKILSKAGKLERVRLIDTGDRRVTVKASRSQWHVPTVPADDFPLAPISAFAPDCGGTVDRAQFLADLVALSPAMNAEETRYYLHGVALQVRELGGRDRFVMAATDGYMMAAASRPIPAGCEAWGSAIMHRRAVSFALAADKLAGPGDMTLSRSGAFLALEFGALRILSKLVDDTYPDWPRAFESIAAPIDGEGQGALFPELLPEWPLPRTEALQKAAAGAIVWQGGNGGVMGECAADPGMMWAAMYIFQGGHARRAGGFSYDEGLAVEVTGDREYRIATKGAKIELTKEQVAALCGDSLWDVLEFPGADGRPRYVSQWLWDDGCSRFLVVGKDGRCPKAGAPREYVTRAEVEAALAGESVTPTPAECEIPEGNGPSRPGALRYRPMTDARLPQGHALYETYDLATGKVEWSMMTQGEARERCERMNAESYHTRQTPEDRAAAMPAPTDTPEAPAINATPASCQPAADWRSIAARGARLGLTQGDEESNGEFLLRIEALEAALPAQTARPKRTAAHERAVRRAWAERKAARAARFNVLLARDMAANNRRAAEFQRERADALAERVDALEYQSQQDRDAKRAADDACVTYRQRQGEAEDAQRLAEQEAREALAAREDMKRMLADAEARAAAAEAENAQLWAEIETLTAPAAAIAA